MKRAQVPVTVYFRIFEIVLLVLVVGIVYLEVNNVRDGGVYQKKFISRDLALVLDSLTNARGNLYYSYQAPLVSLERFNVEFRNGMVVVDGEGWPYASNRNFPVKEPLELKNPPFIVITKSGNELGIGSSAPQGGFNGLLLECPAAIGEVNKIIIDPGHGYNPVTNEGSQGFVGAIKDASGRAVPESELMLQLGAALRPRLKQQFPRLADSDIVASRSLETGKITLPLLGSVPFLGEEAKGVDERVRLVESYPGAVVLSLHAGRGNPKQNVVKAFVNRNAEAGTFKLACSVLNSIAAKYSRDIDGTAVIPVDLGQLGPDDPKRVLLEGRTAVQLEVGNIDYPGNRLLENLQELAGAIASGVRGYS